ncbi:MAG: SRPBCC domain-containing protein [Reyranellaceae bacterium]
MAAKPSLTLKRRIKAAPEKVYAAWTEPQKLMQWFGPDAGKVVSATTDVRVGGGFRIVFHTMDGEQHDVSGRYDAVAPNEKLSFSWAWRTMPERESHVTLTFKPDGEGTLLTLLHEQFADEAARDGHREGWSGALDKLERLLG